jgi:rRNA maturation RNase YbeY
MVAADEQAASDLPECLPIALIEAPALQLSVYADPELLTLYPDWEARQQALQICLNGWWPVFLEVATDADVFQQLGVDPTHHTLAIELTWTGNMRMQHLNREYRDKDAATDVLSFTLLADSPHAAVWLDLPVLQPGSIFVSIPWAEEALLPDIANREQLVRRYLLERVTHGFLHLHGMHHDTMPDYERVVAIQNRVLAACFPEIDTQQAIQALKEAPDQHDH